MPEQRSPKARLHPLRQALPASAPSAAWGPRDSYAELEVSSNFTFLTGASHPDEYMARAAELGYRALAITDTNTLAGIVRAHVAARDVDLQLVVGARLRLSDVPDMSLLVYPTDLASYGRLCHVLTRGKRRASKGDCHLETIDLADAGEGWIVAAVAPRVPDDAFANWLRRLGEMFRARRLFLAASFGYQQDDRDRIHALADLADHLHLPLLATNNVYYHRADRQSLQDVLACIRHGCMLETAGRRLLANAERHLKSAGEMAALFADWPGALESSLEIAERTRRFTLDQVRYQYPGEVIPSGRTAMTYLGEVTWAGADRRYPRGVPTKVQSQIRHELELIEELNYAHYFLTVYDIACFARSRDILYQGRGAAANSAVCYCLFVTSVDPDRVNVLFERFISRERDEPPDIDIDFEHERREEVIQYLYAKYGRDRAALTAEVITYRWRSALREVGKVLGLPPDTLEKFSSAVEGWSGKRMEDEQIRAMGLDPAAMVVRHLLDLAEQLLGFPRHLSQHVGGFVITEDPLCRLVPIENAAMADRTVIEWDKDDIEAMGMLKVDLLGLGMLTCIRKCFALIEEHHQRRLTLADVPADDPAVYDMICRADTVGVFQIESRAQMSMLPRLRPRCYYDLVIEVAIVRPGPIQGDMVHPYLRRRSGQEPVTYPDDTVKQILERTLGVPLFQEQAMTLAIRCAGFTPGEADDLRRAIAAWRHKTKVIDQFGRRIMEGMIGRGYEKEFAQRCFDQIKGFSGYGFPESHAASFALLAYVSAYLKHHYPAAFACALLNSQPMGFYAPAQIVRDAQEHGVEVRPVDVHHSQWDCTLESGGRALRLGMRRIRGMRKEEGRAVAGAFESGNSPRSIERLWRQSGVRVSTLKHLALADAFASMGLDRQQALWKILPLRDRDMPLFENDQGEETEVRSEALPVVSAFRQVAEDYASTGLSLKQHPMAFLRSYLDGRGVTAAGDLTDEQQWPQGKHIELAGLCLGRQRPATASGIVFMTLEDETASFNLVVRPRVYDRCRGVVRGAMALLVRGMVQREGRVIHVVAEAFWNLDSHFAGLNMTSRDFR